MPDDYSSTYYTRLIKLEMIAIPLIYTFNLLIFIIIEVLEASLFCFDFLYQSRRTSHVYSHMES